MHLLAEFGGTNARFALVDPSNPGELLNLSFEPCARFSSAEEAVGWYLEEMGVPKVAAGCVSIAGPTDVASLRVSNKDWTLDPAHIKKLMGAEHVEFLNDFEALAYALPFLSDEEKREIHPGFVSIGKPMAVLGPGTGLGVAGLLPNGNRYTVIKSEGGGIGFAPEDELERAVMLHLNAQLGRVTCEDVLCGSGIVRLYGAISEVEGMTPADYGPADISERALEGSDALCLKTIHAFCHILGHFAGDIALMFNAAGGVYLGGGILEKIRPIFLDSNFGERFLSRGPKSHLVKNTPVFLVEHEVPALLGASYWLQHQLLA
jgi:glucokinase